MPEYEYIGDGRPDGTVIIRAATEKGGFYGTTPAVQPASTSQAVGNNCTDGNGNNHCAIN